MQFILLKSATCRSITGSWSIMVMGFVGVEFMVVHMVVGASVLIKSACSLKTGYLQLRLFRSGFGPQAQEVACPR